MKKLLSLGLALAVILVCDARDWEQGTLGEGDSESLWLYCLGTCVYC